MKKNKKTKEVIDIAKLKEKAIEQFLSEDSSTVPSAELSEVTENGRVKIIILRDSEKNILAHFQLLNDGNLLKLNN
ncbi:MAG: hypothetical protein ACEPO8_10870 [Rhodothermaceae bacterium]